MCIRDRFDTFITESLLPLAMGIPVVLADDEQMLLPWETAALMERYAVKMMQFTPSRLRLCLGSDAFCAAAPGLDRIILVGEAVSEGLFRDFRSVSKAKVFNLYGPTEAAVYVTAAQLQDCLLYTSICKAPPAEKMRLTGQRSSSKAASRPRSSRFTARRSARWESAKAICCPKVSAMR